MESITLPIAVWLSWLGPCANKKRWFEPPGNQSALLPGQALRCLLLGSSDTAPWPSLIYHKLPLLYSALLMPLFLPLLAPVIPPAGENHTIVQLFPPQTHTLPSHMRCKTGSIISPCYCLTSSLSYYRSYSFAGAAITKYYIPGSLNNRNSFSQF